MKKRIENPEMNRIQPMGLIQRVIVVVVCLACCIYLAYLSTLSDQASWLENCPVYEESIQATQDGNQYNHLADALLAGHLYLDLPVSDILLNMDNPYDTEMRRQLNADVGDDIYWDYAYYNGHYYCYFGVIPCLLTFLPFKVLTGTDLKTHYVVVLFACAVVVAAALFVRQLQRVYFKQTGFAAYLVALLLLVIVSGVMEQVFFPRFYPVPILSAVMFDLLGLFFWLRAKERFASGREKPYMQLILGALCVACTLGCRPQHVVTALLAFPLFWREIRRRLFFSRKGLGNTLATIVPFLLVCVPIGWYNYARFGSPLNFGASYNLTGADMTSYTFEPLTIAIQTLEYLFLPLIPQGEFPFIRVVDSTRFAELLWSNEPYYAGFMFLSPVTFIVLALIGRKVRAQLAQRNALGISLFALVLALFLIVVSASVSGVNMRYFADFAWLVATSSILCFWALLEQYPKRRRTMLVGVSVLIVCGFVLYSWTFLGTERFSALQSASPELYNALASLFS